MYDSYIQDSKMSNGASIIDGGLVGGSATAETHPHINEEGLYPSERFKFFKPPNEESPSIQLTDNDLTDLNDLGQGLER
ncbi:MAG: hypothetical protein GX972_07285 [Amphibacillus sp.]|nr:hypothetical protein [Amphibacillus sp.]